MLINVVVCRLAVDDLHEPCGGQQRQAGPLLRLAILRCREGTIKLLSVADPDPGSGAFLTPGFGIRDG
jgi:hypothetical protein